MKYLFFLFLLSTNAWALEKAIFAGGCFWCMQGPFDQQKGVASTRVGYTGGTKINPTYKEVSAGGTGHLESVEVSFDPTQVSYKELLAIFWKNIDPYNKAGQFCDTGEQYTSAIFYEGDAQKKAAEESKQALTLPKDKIATAIRPAMIFYAAEEYHQSYYKKNPLLYKYYRFRCGRDQRLKEVWKNAP